MLRKLNKLVLKIKAYIKKRTLPYIYSTIKLSLKNLLKHHLPTFEDLYNFSTLVYSVLELHYDHFILEKHRSYRESLRFLYIHFPKWPGLWDYLYDLYHDPDTSDDKIFALEHQIDHMYKKHPKVKIVVNIIIYIPIIMYSTLTGCFLLEWLLVNFFM